MKKYFLLTIISFLLFSFTYGQKKEKIIVIKSTEHQAERLYNDAVKSYESKQYAEAIDFLNQSLKINDSLATSYHLLSIIQQEMGNKQAAIQTLQTYSKATHHKDTAAYMIAQVFYGDNNLDSASSYLNYCISKNPSYFNAFYLLGNINFEQEKYNDAISNYTKVINISTTSADAYNDRASAKRMLEKYDEAIEDYNMAITLKKNALFYNNRGSAKMKLEKYDEAIEDYTTAILLDSNCYQAINNRGVAKIEKKDYKGAIEDFNLCVKRKKDYYAAINNRGIAYYKNKRYKEAIEDFNFILSVNPSEASAYLHRGNTKEMLRDNEGACSDWKKAAELGIEEAKGYVKKQCEKQ